MNSIQLFNSEPLINALKAFFKELKVPVDYLADEPASPTDVLGERFKATNEAHKLIADVYALGMVNDGIFEGRHLKEKPLDFLVKHFGKSGAHYYHIVRGVHKSEVKPNRIRKSVGAERTFFENLTSELFMVEQLRKICESLSKSLHKSKISGKTITLKIKYSDFSVHTRSKTLPYFIADNLLILKTAKELLYQEKLENSVRLLGISLSNLNTEKKEKVSVQLKFDF